MVKKPSISISINEHYLPLCVRDNILMGNCFVKNNYDRIVRACGLSRDFVSLASGDLTWVHGNGENLSGGQKQRICLARAVFQGSPIYVLDDPLSAVDPALRASIFNDVIGPNGLLRKKTRIVIMNEHSMAEAMDKILLMQNKTLIDVGTIRELQRRHDVDLEVRVLFNAIGQ